MSPNKFVLVPDGMMRGGDGRVDGWDDTYYYGLYVSRSTAVQLNVAPVA
jgi:hypothetical protein